MGFLPWVTLDSRLLTRPRLRQQRASREVRPATSGHEGGSSGRGRAFMAASVAQDMHTGVFHRFGAGSGTFPPCCAESASFGTRLSVTSEPQWEVPGGLSLAAKPGASQDGQYWLLPSILSPCLPWAPGRCWATSPVLPWVQPLLSSPQLPDTPAQCTGTSHPATPACGPPDTVAGGENPVGSSVLGWAACPEF